LRGVAVLALLEDAGVPAAWAIQTNARRKLLLRAAGVRRSPFKDLLTWPFSQPAGRAD